MTDTIATAEVPQAVIRAPQRNALSGFCLLVCGPMFLWTGVFALGEFGAIIAAPILVVWVANALAQGPWTRLLLSGIGFAMAFALLVPWIQGTRPHSRFTICKNTLHSFGIAFHSYNAAYHTLPPAVVVDDQGHPKHSWRGLLAAHDAEEETRKIHNRLGRPAAAKRPKYDLSEPWDGPNNQRFQSWLHSPWETLMQSEPPCIAIPFAVVGPETAWSNHRGRPRTLYDLGSSAVLLISKCEPASVGLKPRDLSVEEAIAILSEPSQHGFWETRGLYDIYRGVPVLFADSSVRLVQPITPEVARNLFAVNSRQKVDDSVWTQPPLRRLRSDKLVSLSVFMAIGATAMLRWLFCVKPNR